VLVSVIPIGTVGTRSIAPFLRKKALVFGDETLDETAETAGSAHSGKPEVLLGVLPDTYIARIDT